MRRTRFILIACLTALLKVQAAEEFIFEYEGINADIPELNPAGITDVRTIDVEPGLIIFDINVSVIISGSDFGGFNGDLYATLQHDSGYSVLLNRVGARDGFPSGYSDIDGLSVTFDDAAPADVHSYRLTLNGNETIPLTGPLVGSWSPDARNVDPLTASQSSPRTAFLDSFNGLAVGGEWTLFISDRSAGGTHQLESWSLEIQAIPEPSIGGLALLCGLVLFCKQKFSKNRRREI